MAKTKFESLCGFERAALARMIQTHGVTSVLVEIGSIIKSDSTQKVLAKAVAEINGNIKERQIQKQSSTDQPVL